MITEQDKRFAQMLAYLVNELAKDPQLDKESLCQFTANTHIEYMKLTGRA